MSAPIVTRPAGDLRGPAPIPHQVREIVVKVEQLPDGMWRLTQPRVPGWAVAARNPVEVANALRRGFSEAQIAAHADWRGQDYDAKTLRHRRQRRKRRSPNPHRGDVYDPRDWQYAPDGRWISPAGNRYPEDSQAVRSVIGKRIAMGLPSRPDPMATDGKADPMGAGRSEG